MRLAWPCLLLCLFPITLACSQGSSLLSAHCCTHCVSPVSPRGDISRAGMWLVTLTTRSWVSLPFCISNVREDMLLPDVTLQPVRGSLKRIIRPYWGFTARLVEFVQSHQPSLLLAGGVCSL